MLKKPHFFLKSLLAFLLFCLALTSYNIYTRYQFQEFSHSLALDYLKNNPMELHFTLHAPDQYGIDPRQLTLRPFSTEFLEDEKTYYVNAYQKLEDFTFTHDIHYQQLDSYLSLKLESFQYSYYAFPLSPYDGVQNTLPILLSEYSFSNKTDVELYLDLLAQLPDYLNGLTIYMQEKEKLQLSPFIGNLEESADQCDSLALDYSLLEDSFHTKLSLLQEHSLISEEELDKFLSTHSHLLETSYAPALLTLANDLRSLTGSPTLSGLSSFPSGQDYYSFLLKSQIGTDRSVEEIKALLFEQFEILYLQLSTLKESDFLTELSLPSESYEEILDILYQSSLDNFPPLTPMPNIRMEEVAESLQASSAPAFYITPPIDNNTNNVIYINPKTTYAPIDLFVTLAHEGFPGHLYQTVYSQNFLQSEEAELMEYLISYGGYTEGWGIYSEFYSYDILRSQVNESYHASIDFHQVSQELQLALSALLDIYIHYDGASISEVSNLLESLGFDTSIAPSLYDLICNTPGNYPKYYVGYLEIMALKKSAQNLYPDSYTDYYFHTWFLEHSSSTFTQLNQLLYDSEIFKN